MENELVHVLLRLTMLLKQYSAMLASKCAGRTDEICILALTNALGDILQCALVVDAVKVFLLALLCEYDQPQKF